MMDVPQRQPRPLGFLTMLFLPLLLLLFRGERRLSLERRAEYTRKLRDYNQSRKLIAKDLEREANEDWQIIESIYTRMGHVYLPRHAHQSASGQRKGKAQKVRCEACFVSLDAPEIIYFKLMTRRAGRFATANALPYNTFAGDLVSEDRLRELSWGLQRVVTAVYEDPRFGIWLRVHRLEGVGGLATKVSFSQMLEHYPEDMSRGTLILGKGAHQKIHSVDLANHPHVLIAGSTGSGKSNMVNQLIAALMMFTDPADLQFILIDLKRMEFKLFRHSAHLYKPVISDAETAIEALTDLVQQIEDRAVIMEHSDFREIASWNEQNPDRKLQRIICIIDEFAELRLASDKDISNEAARLVNRICNLGRAVGVHLWVCTQRPARAVLGNEVKINMPLIIAGRTQSKAQSAVILDNGDAADLPQVPGRMLYQSGSNQWEIQTPYVSEDEIKYACSVSRGRALGVIELDGVEPVIVPDKLIEVVAEQGGALSVNLVDELLCEYAITRKMFRAFCQEVIALGRMEVKGRTYSVLKKGNAYQLVMEAEQAAQQPDPQSDPEPPGKPQLMLLPAQESTPSPESEQEKRARLVAEFKRIKESRSA